MNSKNKITGNSFECTLKRGKENVALTAATSEMGIFKVLTNGMLQGTKMLDVDGNRTRTQVWNFEEYCVVYTKNYNNEEISQELSDISTPTTSAEKTSAPDEGFEFSYMFCEKDERIRSWCETFTLTLNPILLSISIIFLSITLIIYDSFHTSIVSYRIS